MPPSPTPGSEPSTPHLVASESAGTPVPTAPIVPAVQVAGEVSTSSEGPATAAANSAVATDATATAVVSSAAAAEGSESPVTASSSVPTYTPDPANTRVLLRSLEDLRDSLSVRVEQLSLAVDRLRGQATELERAVSTGTALAPGFGRPRASDTATSFEPLPRPQVIPAARPQLADVTPPLPIHRSLRRAQRPRLSDSVSITETITRLHGAFTDQVEPRPRGPSPPPFEVPFRRPGLAPTNLRAVATQPKPAVVRSSRAPSAEPEEATSEDAPSSSSPRSAPHGAAEPSSESAGEGITVETTTTTRLAQRAAHQLPTTEPSYFSVLESPVRRRAPPPSTLAPGMTLTGMRVEERIRAASDEPTAPSTNTSAPSQTYAPPRPSTRPNIPHGREELDREIHRVHRRLEESQREWYQFWNAERSRTLRTGGRVPNEYSASRESAMRTHVENSHLLWTLVSRRTRLYGGPSADPVSPAEPRLAVDPMRHNGETSPVSPLFGRGGATTAGSRRWPSTFADTWHGEFRLGNADDPAQQNQTDALRRAQRRAMTDRLIQRLQNERLQNDLASDTDVHDDEIRLPRLQDADVMSLDDNVRALERLNAEMPTTYRYTPLNTNGVPTPTETPLPTHNGTTPAFSFDEDLPPSQMRRQLLRYIERSRERVHQIARDLTPELLATEEPAMRRVLDGIELMMASPNITPHIRSRLERLAERERGLLRDLERGMPRTTDRNRTTVEPADRGEVANLVGLPNLPPPSPVSTTSSLSSSMGDPILDRIERSRARVRDLSRVYRELQATRASLGFDSAPRPESFSRRGSDAETVVPPSFSVADVVTISDDEVPPPIPAPPARLTSRSYSQPSVLPTYTSTPTVAPVAATPSVAAPVIQRPMTVPAVQIADDAESMVPSSSSSSSVSSASSASSASNRATISHARDEEPPLSAAERKESGEFETQDWASPPRRRPVRPYVSLLDL